MIFQYIRRNGPLPKGIVHLGAYTADEVPWYMQSGAEFVIWAEANPEMWATTKKSLARYPNQYLFEGAITDKDDGEIVFHIYNHPEASSIFVPGKDLNIWYPEHQNVRTAVVPTITLDTLVERSGYPIEKIGYLALDIQGAELMALQHGGKLLSSPGLAYVQTEAIYGEYYVGGVHGSELFKMMEEYGFELVETERHTPTYKDVANKIARGELTPIDQMNLLFKRKS